MNDVTNNSDSANVGIVTDNVQDIVELAIATLAPNLAALQLEMSEHSAKSDRYKPFAKMQREIDAGNGWKSLEYYFGANLAGAEQFDNPVALGIARDNMAKLAEYRTWQLRLVELDEAIKSNVNPLRDLTEKLSGITGDRTIHKTFIPRGNKQLAGGGSANHGYICQVFSTIDESLVTYVDESGETHEFWNSINNVGKTFLPWSIAKHEYINQNSNATERALLKRGIMVKRIGQDV